MYSFGSAECMDRRDNIRTYGGTRCEIAAGTNLSPPSVIVFSVFREKNFFGLLPASYDGGGVTLSGSETGATVVIFSMAFSAAFLRR